MIKEEKLEPIARNFRFRQGLMEICKDKVITLVDLGCGPLGHFYFYASNNHIPIKKYIGIDPLLIKQKRIINNNTQFIKSALKNNIPLKDNCADYVVGFAFLEHLDNHERIIEESLRILKKGGKAIFTMPTKRAKFILDILSSKFSLISSREIEEHKNYFDKQNIIKILPKKYKNINVKHKYFELGLNNLLVIEKL